MRRDRIWLTTTAGRSRVRRRVPSHIGERRARIGRTDERAAVCRKPLGAVRVRTAEINHIRLAWWRVDYIVVPALAVAVVDVLRRSHVRKDGCTGGVIGAVKTSC